MSLNCWLKLRWFSQLTVPPPDTVQPRWLQFFIFSVDFTTDYYRVCDHHNVVFKYSPLLTVTWVFQIVAYTGLITWLFNDVPISFFLGNIRLQCKQCAYRPSYRCQQLRRNYIKYNYTLTPACILYIAYKAITGWQLLLYTPTFIAPNQWTQQSRS